MHVQRVGLNAETKKVLAPSRRGKFLLTFPFIGHVTRRCGILLILKPAGVLAKDRILPAHLADQISDLTRNDRSSRLAAPYLPGPEQSKAGAMPSYDRFWLDDGQRRSPIAPETGETDPQEAVAGG